MHNPQIVELLSLAARKPFAIDRDYADQMLNTYLQEVSLRESGVEFAEMGYAARREKSFPTVIGLDEQGAAMEKPWSELQTVNGGVAVVRLTGVMRSQDGISSRGVQSFTDALMQADNAPNIKGIVVEINSGGGEWTAGVMASGAIASVQKPIVSVSHMAGSAAYMAAISADKVYASTSGSQIGSIGVFVSLPKDFPAIYNEMYEDIYATPSGKKNRAFREWLQGSKAGYQEQVDRLAETFAGMVREQRELTGSPERIADTLSGEMFGAVEATERGMIDGTKTVYEAAQEITRMATAMPVFNSNENENTMSKETKVLTQIKNLLGMSAGVEVEANEPVEDLEGVPAVEEAAEATETEATEQEVDQTQELLANLTEKIEALETRIGDINTGLIDLENKVNADAEDRKANVEAAMADVKAALKEIAGVSVADNAEAEAPSAERVGKVAKEFSSDVVAFKNKAKYE
jgi:ClpP class serine protease